LSEREYHAAEQARETAEIEATPETEQQEFRDIYAAKGFAGDLLDQVVDPTASLHLGASDGGAGHRNRAQRGCVFGSASTEQ
jgi:hypothetical protein